MLDSITVLRGFSAFFVLVFHAVYYEASFRGGGPYAIEGLANHLSLSGITTFFCLSGYLMARLVERETFTRFVARRALRIYLPLVGATALALLADAIGLLDVPDFPWYALTLLPVGKVNRPLGVEWTLVYEVFYYAVTALFCFAPLRRWFPALVAVWLVVVLTAAMRFDFYGSDFEPPANLIVFSVWNLGFLVGALGRLAEKAGWLRASWVIPGVMIWAVSGQWGVGVRAYLIPLGVGLIVMAGIAWESKHGLNPPRWMLLLGDASYGLYLLHVTVVRSVLHAVGPLPEWPPGTLALLGIVLSILIAGSFGLLEHSVYRRLTSRRRPG